jgi:isopenicillin N synthase-like dioxygenase
VRNSCNSSPSGIHYGTHFTNTFTRCYKDRVTTRRIHEEDRMRLLSQ